MRPLVTFFLITLVAAQFEYLTDAGAFLDQEYSGSGIPGLHLDLEHGHQDHDLDDCDHCCHGAGHLTAMAVNLPLAVWCGPAAESDVAPVSLASLAMPPPVPPPIS
ncbi:MAG: hypothetical protein CL798_04735 [Chromatiales bacterium]|jgi:hypothetical protein|nr:hypothetical protein [Chromatiales bacterium]